MERSGWCETRLAAGFGCTKIKTKGPTDKLVTVAAMWWFYRTDGKSKQKDAHYRTSSMTDADGGIPLFKPFDEAFVFHVHSSRSPTGVQQEPLSS